MEYINKIKLLLNQLENNKSLDNINFVSAMNTTVQQLEYHINKLDVIKISSQPSSQPSSPLYNQNINTNTNTNTNINFNQLEQLGKLTNLHQKE